MASEYACARKPDVRFWRDVDARVDTAWRCSASATHEGFEPGERLRYRGEFEKAYEQGRRMVSRFFVGFLLRRESGPLRLGVVASRRVGGAVRRNRAKRLLREVYRRNRPASMASVDLVLVARRSIVEASYRDIEALYSDSVGKAIERRP